MYFYLNKVKLYVNTIMYVSGFKTYQQTIPFKNGNGCSKTFDQSSPTSGSPVSCASNMALDMSSELVDGER